MRGMFRSMSATTYMLDRLALIDRGNTPQTESVKLLSKARDS